ncbi:MAG: hypothetical protein AAGD06_22995 [Acidobacteriota bacterium]
MPASARPNSHFRTSPFLILAISLVALIAGSPSAHADDESTYRSFINGIGEMVCAFAWPTAEYERVSYEGYTDISGGARIRFRIHATSAWGGGALWTDVVVEMANGTITDLSWGQYNSFVPPGTTISALGEALGELTQEWAESSGTSPSYASQGLTNSGSSSGLGSSVRSQLDAEGSRLRRQGFTESHNAVFNSLGDNRSANVRLELQRGRRYKIVGYCDSDCSDLDLALLTSGGSSPLASDVLTDDYPKIEYLPSSSGSYVVKVSMVTCSIEPCTYGVGFFSK